MRAENCPKRLKKSRKNIKNVKILLINDLFCENCFENTIKYDTGVKAIVEIYFSRLKNYFKLIS